MDRTTMETKHGLHVSVRRIHRRDLNRTWEFIKRVFRDVNRETVEYQRPRTKRRFFETYAQEGVEQLVFEIGKEIVGYAECSFDATGDDNWVNPRYFDNRGMRPLYIEELAVHPDYQGQGVGGFMLDQLQHLGRVRGCTHLVLEVAENNQVALGWYRRRNFFKLDAAIFMAQKLMAEPELLPPRRLSARKQRKPDEASPAAAQAEGRPATKARRARVAAGAKRAAAAPTPEPEAARQPAPKKRALARRRPKHLQSDESPAPGEASPAAAGSLDAPATAPAPAAVTRIGAGRVAEPESISTPREDPLDEAQEAEPLAASAQTDGKLRSL